MGARRRARERVLQALYAFHINSGTDLDRSEEPLAPVLADLRSRFPLGENDSNEPEPGSESGEDREYASMLFAGVLERLSDVDRMVATASSAWRPDRMDVVDLCVIRVAVYEMAFLEEVPPAVAINEAVELARKYGNEQSSPFVNGVLDRVRINLEEENTRAEP